MSIDVQDPTMGQVISLPLHSVAGETASLRRQLIGCLAERRDLLVDEMVDAVLRVGLVSVLQPDGVSAGTRIAAAVDAMLDIWEHSRPLEAHEMDALRTLGEEVGRAGVPLWRLLSGGHEAVRAGWEYALHHAVATLDNTWRTATAVQLAGDLSHELLDVVGRAAAQLAAGYADTAGGRGRIGGVPGRG